MATLRPVTLTAAGQLGQLADADELKVPHARVLVAAADASPRWKSRAAVVCTGVGDQAAINAQLTALSTAGGGIVELSPGHFYINGKIVGEENTTLAGQGRKSTWIAVSSGSNLAAIVEPRISPDGVLPNARWFTLRDLTVDGNRAGQTGGLGHGFSRVVNPLWSKATQDTGFDMHHTVRDCDFVNVRGTAIYGDGRGEDNYINVMIKDCGAGVYPPADTNIVNVVVGACSTYGLKISNASVRIIGGKVWYTGWYWDPALNSGAGGDAWTNSPGLWIANVAGGLVTVVGLEAQDNGGPGLLLDGANQANVVMSLDSNCRNASGGSAGMDLWATDGCTIQAALMDRFAAPTQLAGVRLRGGSVGNTITLTTRGQLTPTGQIGVSADSTDLGSNTVSAQYETAGGWQATPIQLLAEAVTAPAAPASGATLYADTRTQRRMLAGVGAAGPRTVLQPSLARGQAALWLPPGNAATVPGVIGMAAPTALGTATARTITTTSLATRLKRLGYVSAATAGSLAGLRQAAAQYSCGSGSLLDGAGLYLVERWVESDAAAVSGKRSFAGVASSVGAPTNVEPSTLTNAIGVAQLSTDATQWYWVGAGSAAQSAVAVGTAVGAPSGASTTAWELVIWAPPNVANTYYCTLTNLTTGVSATKTYSGGATLVPQSSTLLAWRHWVTNNATALATAVDIASVSIETMTWI